jgi:peptide-methionine (S)-S-oxide reductase
VSMYKGIAVLAALALLSTTAAAQQTKTAIFAAGCFWCVESDFDKVDGVVSTLSGYTGGTLANPTYEQVGHGGTGHREAVQVTYDPARVSYEALLEVYWANVDPLDAAGQFCDKGESYKPAIFTADAAQEKSAQDSKAAAEKKLGQKVVVIVAPAKPFYAAEDYHQDYYKKNPIRYKYYRTSCGRDARLNKVWGADGGHRVALGLASPAR